MTYMPLVALQSLQALPVHVPSAGSFKTVLAIEWGVMDQPLQ
jgi:hypothetical protein